jgi:hypothetical protein
MNGVPWICHICKGSPVASGFMSSDMLKGQ